MKRTATILLIAILLFNWGGYEFLVSCLQHYADRKLEAKLDIGDYDQAQLVELVVPFDLPYTTDWENFERVDGDVVIEGAHYKFVERQYKQGLIIYKCIPNGNKSRLQNVRDVFFQFSYDVQHANGNKKPLNNTTVVKKGISDYEPCIDVTRFGFVIEQAARLCLYNAEACAAGYLHLYAQPPEVNLI